MSSAISRKLQPITAEEIDDALRNMSNTSAPRISGLNYKALKWAFCCYEDKLVAIVRASIKLGFHHPRWKTSLAVSVPKSNKLDYSSPRAHRPIQLIECLGKVVEKVITKRLLFDAGKFNLILFNQFGRRSN